MRLWFSPASEVPIYRQLFTQIVLAILSGDLKAGDRLPSTRELARRFSIHPNTVSAGYRQLTEEGWAEYRHGSGVYVKTDAAVPSTPEQILDKHIVAFFRAVRELKLSSEAIRTRVANGLPHHRRIISSSSTLIQMLVRFSSAKFVRRPAGPQWRLRMKKPPTQRCWPGHFPCAGRARRKQCAHCFQ